jgi:hypothetical protein
MGSQKDDQSIKLPGAKGRGDFRFDLKVVEEFEKLYRLELRK